MVKSILILFFVFYLFPSTVKAIPVFARNYNISCVACHSAYPKLNAGGASFADNNFRFDNWKSTTLKEIADSDLWLPEIPALAMRIQAFAQGRDNFANYDQTTGAATEKSDFDIQAPYLIKLLSSAPLTDQLTYYFYGIFAEKGKNGTVVIEDAWFQYNDLFGSGISMQLGQFQVSDLMFPREVRLTFQDYMVYRMADITYQRGILFGREFGPINLDIGVVNGNGIAEDSSITSPGYKRADHTFDNNNDKSVFGRLGFELFDTAIGLFAYKGRQYQRTGTILESTNDKLVNKSIIGFDLAKAITGKVDVFSQVLANSWENFDSTQPEKDFNWSGGFVGVDYIYSPKWAFSLLQNYVDNGDFENADNIFRGLEMNTTSIGASYYLARNAKLLLEFNIDWLDVDTKTQNKTYGHQSKENSVVLGFDAAF